MNVVVKRSKWLRGETFNSFLFRESDGKMCCLGFLGEACGLSPDDMKNRVTPNDLSTLSRKKFYNKFFLVDYDLRCDIFDTNDIGTIPDSIREKKLIKLFNCLGIKLSFED